MSRYPAPKDKLASPLIALPLLLIPVSFLVREEMSVSPISEPTDKGPSPWLTTLIVIPLIFLLLLKDKGLSQFRESKKKDSGLAPKKNGTSLGRMIVIILITTVIVVGVMGDLTFDGFRAARDGRPPDTVAERVVPAREATCKTT